MQVPLQYSLLKANFRRIVCNLCLQHKEHGIRQSSIRSSHRIAFSKSLDGTIDTTDPTYQKNLENSSSLAKKYLDVLAISQAGGGPKAVERHTKRNKKILVRDRVRLLLDEDSDFFELSPVAGMGMEYGDVPQAAIVGGIGKIHNTYCMLVCNDATVKGGTVYPITVKKQIRLQQIAEQNRIPCIYVVDSGGGFLPLQAALFPDKLHGGRVFYNEAIMSSLGIPQIAIVCGSCTAGAAYVPTMAEDVVMVDKIATIFLGGPPLVQAATGEVVTPDELGGAKLHTNVSGCADYFANTEEEGFEMGRDIVASLNVPPSSDPGDYEEPLYSSEELAGIIPATDCHEMDAFKVLARIVDGSKFHEFKPTFGSTLVTGYAHIQGHLVGILANNGPITEKAALKAAHFIQICSARQIPLIFLQNSEPDKLFTDSVSEGEILGNTLRAQGKMIAALSTCKVPKITVIIGGSYGGNNYMMSGSAFDPNFIFVWPNAKIGMAEPEKMKNILREEMLKGGQTQTEEESKELEKKLTSKVDLTTSALYSSSRMWNDGIVLPKDTRKVLGQCLNILNRPQAKQSDNESPFFRM